MRAICMDLHGPAGNPSIAMHKEDSIKSFREYGGACNMHGREKNAYRVLMGKPEEKGSLGRPRPRWKENIKMEKIGWNGLN
jgi:hypothetical protein